MTDAQLIGLDDLVGTEVSLDTLKTIMDNHDKQNPKWFSIYYNNSKVHLAKDEDQSDITIMIEPTGTYPMFKILAIEVEQITI